MLNKNKLQLNLNFLNKVLLTVVVSLLFLFPSNSADLGWHLRYGQYFFQTGQILMKNVFSFVMPNFIWTNDSWLYDLFTYQIFQNFGFIGLSVVGALTALILFFSIYVLYKPKSYCLLPIAYCLYLLISPRFYSAFRAQTLSLLGLVFCLWQIKQINAHKLTANFYIISSVVYIFWANFSGEFMLGLALLYLTFIGQLIDSYIKQKKGKVILERSDRILSKLKQIVNSWFPILLISTISTFLTPFHYKNHILAFEHIFTSRLSTVNEWLPWTAFYWQFWVFLLYFLFLIFYLYKSKKFHSFTFLPPFLAFAYLGFAHRRLVPVFAIISLPLFLQILKKYDKELKNLFTLKTNFILSLLLFIHSLLVVKNRQIWIHSWQDYCDSKTNLHCSEASVDFLKNSKLKGKIFNYYNWRGYLSYRYQDQPIFIVGHMVSWKDNKTGYMPFEVYKAIHRLDENSLQIFQDQNFDYAIIPSNSQFEQMLTSQLNWQIIYQDQKVSILGKN
jgi:hypothetical protein